MTELEAAWCYAENYDKFHASHGTVDRMEIATGANCDDESSKPDTGCTQGPAEDMLAAFAAQLNEPHSPVTVIQTDEHLIRQGILPRGGATPPSGGEKRGGNATKRLRDTVREGRVVEKITKRRCFEGHQQEYEYRSKCDLIPSGRWLGF